MPPIIASTCIAPETRLWLTDREEIDCEHYTASDLHNPHAPGLSDNALTEDDFASEPYSLELTWGVRASELILEHVQLWAFPNPQAENIRVLDTHPNKMKEMGHGSDPIDKSEMAKETSRHDVGFSSGELDDGDQDEEVDQEWRPHQTEESEPGGSSASDSSDECGEGGRETQELRCSISSET